MMYDDDEPIHCERCAAPIWLPRIFTPVLCEHCVALGGP